MASAGDAGDLRSKQILADQQVDSLALIAQVEHAQRVTQQSPVLIMEVANDAAFLCAFASEDSFVGTLDDEDGITDEGIEDFIRKNNPDMFHRLFTHGDATTEIQSEAFNSCAGSHMCITPAKNGAMTASHDLDVLGASPKYYELQHILLQLKRLLVSSLLGGHVLILQKLTVSYAICCGHPFCRFRDAPVLRGNFVLELRLEGVSQARHFCLECVESVFSCRAASAQCHQSLPLAPMVALDGLAEILDAAQRLATTVSKPEVVEKAAPNPNPRSRKILPVRQKGLASIKSYFEPDFPFDHSSNSTQALFLRRSRDAEINEILSDVKKYDNRRQGGNSQRQRSPLVITPPPQVPGEDRYKKQGLGRYDKEKERKIHGKRDTNSGSSNTSTESTKSLIERICHCREAAGVAEVVKCGAEFCPVGTYHLRCTNLLQKPAADMIWYCSNCSGFPEGFLTTTAVSDSEQELPIEDDDDDYDYDCDYCYEYNEYLEYEDASHGDWSESDRMSLVTRSVSTSPESRADTESIVSLVPGVSGVSPMVPSTPPTVIDAVNSSIPINPHTPIRATEAIKSFVPINPDCTPGTVTPFSIRHTKLVSLDGPPSANSQSGAACLPLGWSDVVFEDLAPFIMAETNIASRSALAPEHVGMLEEWRAACPTSRLLPGQRSLSPFHTDSVQSVPLSHLLGRVDLEMGRHKVSD